jgi:uncharacterized protein YcaQ
MRLKISIDDFRKFLIKYQSLCTSTELQGKNGVLDYIKRVGCIQYDALNVAGRNADLVLQSRIRDYSPGYLYELLYIDRKLVDELDKVMSIYPVKDWPYFKRFREAAKHRYGSNPKLLDIIEDVRQIIRDKGPVTSNDLGYNQSVPWSWAPTKLSRAALESMYFWGELIIEKKVNARKTYDFADRYIKKSILQAPDPNRTEEDFLDWYFLRRIGAIGALWNKSSDAWLGIPNFTTDKRTDCIKRLLDKGLVGTVEVENTAVPFYIKTSCNIKKYLNMPFIPKMVILAPLDNFMWDRKLINTVFNFDYKWEVYKPAVERKYGYYVLPVLFGDRFVARFEPLMDKKSGSLIIKNWWWEKGVAADSSLLEHVVICFKNFMRYLNAKTLQIDSSIAKQEGLGCLVNLKIQ